MGGREHTEVRALDLGRSSFFHSLLFNLAITQLLVGGRKRQVEDLEILKMEIFEVLRSCQLLFFLLASLVVFRYFWNQILGS